MENIIATFPQKQTLLGCVCGEFSLELQTIDNHTHLVI